MEQVLIERKRLSAITRWGACAAGGALTAWGLKSGGAVGLARGMVGAALLAAAASERSQRKPAMAKADAVIDVDAPFAEVFARLAADGARWAVRDARWSAAGACERLADASSGMIARHSEKGSLVDYAETIRMSALGAKRTRVEATVRLRAPGVNAGDVAAVVLENRLRAVRSPVPIGGGAKVAEGQPARLAVPHGSGAANN